ncbi:MAG: glycosyltransferase family 4 protein [Thermoleophilia bacterium]|nr:glycosyltransferase family 4 protein [Thermoleophilia bacterium]
MADNADVIAGVRVLVIASEQVGARMAGPAIRASALAGELAAAGAVVTLAMPALPDEASSVPAGVTAAAFGVPSARSLADLVRTCAPQVIVTQPQRVDIAWGLRHMGRPVVYDLYVPSFVERIAQLATEPGDDTLKRRLLDRDRREYATALEMGDAFLCATERQKDHWLGALGQAGRPDLELLARDGRADALIGVVPFGLSSDAMPALGTGGAIRGALVPDDAIVLLWTGGIWNWFDPVTIVEGLARARAREPRLHLVVMGMRHAEAAWEEQDASKRLRARAEELGLLADGGVVLTDAWVPFAERHRWLGDSDIAVCAHRDSLETRLSFRTRFLDHLWAGLPTVSTAGGDLTDRMADAGAALVVPELDVEAWEATLLELAADAPQRERMSVAARQLGEELHWSAVAAPLVRIVAALQESDKRTRRPKARGRIWDLVTYMVLLVRVRIQAKGLGSLREAAHGALGKSVREQAIERGSATSSEAGSDRTPAAR